MSVNLTLKEVCNRMDNQIHPSFLKLLCEQGKIHYSAIPARDGRCNDVFLIDEDEIDKIKQILFESSQVKDLTQEVKKPEPKKVEDTEKWLNTREVAELLGCTHANVIFLNKKGVFVTKEGIVNKGQKGLLYTENSVLSYMEDREKKHNKSLVKANMDKSVELDVVNLKYEKACDDLKAKDTEIENLKKAIDAKEKTIVYFKNMSDKLKRELARRDDSCASRDKQLADLKNKLEVKTREAADLKKANDYIAERLKKLNDKLDDTPADNNGFIRAIAERDQTINKLNADIRSKNERIARLMDDLDKDDTYIKAYAQCKKDLVALIMDM